MAPLPPPPGALGLHLWGGGVSVRGLTTGLVGAAALWAPHLHQGRAHAALHMWAAEALTHCAGGEAGDASDTDSLELESSETLWLRRGYLSAPPCGPLSVLRHPLASRGEVWAPEVSP